VVLSGGVMHAVRKSKAATWRLLPHGGERCRIGYAWNAGSDEVIKQPW